MNLAKITEYSASANLVSWVIANNRAEAKPADRA
jgi:hypothetical protein